MTPARAAFDRATLAFIGVLIAVTAARVYLLLVNPVTLYFDEAQYWMWSRTFDWGYFSKPPLIAWVIAATTALTGSDAEWAVRLASPIAQSIAGLGVFLLARSMYGAWAGFWAGIGWLVLPAVFLSSNLISTDAMLLPLWCIALFAMWRMVSTRAFVWALVIGAALGVGMLAKYAMIYFVVCTAVAAWWLPPVRQALAGGRGIAAALIAIAIVTPNLIWNVQNGFATVTHTASNASLNLDDMFHIDEFFEFYGGQITLLGPLVLLVLFWAWWRAARRSSGLSTEDKFLLAYILPPFVFISTLAFISRANANWAAVAYPAVVIWLTGSLFSSAKGRRTLVAAVAINFALCAGLMYVIGTSPAWANWIKAVRTSQGWDSTAREIALRAAPQAGEAPFSAVLVDDRQMYFELNYYWREARRAGMPLPPVRMWLLHGAATNSAEANDPMRPEEGGRVLVVHMQPRYLPLVAGDFSVFRTVEHLAVPLGGGYNRELEISVGEGFAPVTRDATFEERIDAVN